MSNKNPSPSSHVTMVGACATAIATLVPVALFQFSVLKHLPDPPGYLFASDRITSSKAARPFGIPDSVLGLASYSTTLGLALRAPSSRLARKALGAKLLLDGGFVALNTVRQLVAFKRVCSWCMLTGAATVVMVASGREYLSEGPSRWLQVLPGSNSET